MEYGGGGDFDFFIFVSLRIRLTLPRSFFSLTFSEGVLSGVPTGVVDGAEEALLGETEL